MECLTQNRVLTSYGNRKVMYHKIDKCEMYGYYFLRIWDSMKDMYHKIYKVGWSNSIKRGVPVRVGVGLDQGRALWIICNESSQNVDLNFV